MPRKRFAKKKKPFVRRRRVKRARRNNIANQMVGFPNNKVVKMRYVEQLAFGTAGGKQELSYRANSIFDPNAQAGGHQPLGHDQWAQFYVSYAVLGSKIKCRASAQSTGTVPIIWGIQLATVDTQTADLNTICEQGKAPWRLMQPAINGNQQTCTQRYSAKKWYNLTDVKDNLNRVGAQFGANPVDEAFYNIFCGAADQFTNIPIVDVFLQIDYIVLLSDPVPLAGS